MGMSEGRTAELERLLDKAREVALHERKAQEAKTVRLNMIIAVALGTALTAFGVAWANWPYLASCSLRSNISTSATNPATSGDQAR